MQQSTERVMKINTREQKKGGGFRIRMIPTVVL